MRTRVRALRGSALGAVLLASCPGVPPSPHAVSGSRRDAARADAAASTASPPAARLLVPLSTQWPAYGAASFAGDGSRVAVLHEGRAYVVDLTDAPGRVRGDVHGPFADRDEPQAAIPSPDGSRVAVIVPRPRRSPDLVVYDVATGAQLCDAREIDGVSFLGRGDALLTTLAKPERKPAVLDANTCEVLRSFGKGNGRTAGDEAITWEDGVHVWNPRTGALLAVVGRGASRWATVGSTHVWLAGGVARAFDLRSAQPVPLADADSCPGIDVAIDPGERQVGVLTSDGDLCLWALPSGALRRLPWTGARLKDGPRSLSLAPTAASISLPRDEHRYVDTTTNTVVTEADYQARQPMAFSGDGALGALFDPRTVIDVATGKRLYAYDGERPAFSPDGRALAFRGPTHGLVLVDARTGAPLFRALPRALPLEGLARTPDGTDLVGVPTYREGSGVVLDPATFAPLRPLAGSFAPTSGLAVAWKWPGGTAAEIVDSQEPTRFRAPFPAGSVAHLGASPDGRWVGVFVYDFDRKGPDQNHLAVLSTTGGPAREVLAPSKYLPSSLAVTSDGKVLVGVWQGGGPDTGVFAWDVDSGRRTVEHLSAQVVVVSPVGHDAVLLDPDVRTVDLATGRMGPTITMPTQNAAAAISGDGKLLAVGGWGTWTTLVDLERGTTRVLQDSEDVTSATFSRDGALLYGRAADGIGAWRVGDGAALWRANPLGAATLLRGRDGTMELAGDARAGAAALSCAAGGRVYGFERCDGGAISPGVIERALRTPFRRRP